MGDFELNLFLNFGRHLFARTVRRFCSYIKQTSSENGGRRAEVKGQKSDVRNGEFVRWRIRGQRPQNFKNAKRQTPEKPQNPKSEVRASCLCASVAVWPDGSVSHHAKAV